MEKTRLFLPLLIPLSLTWNPSLCVVRSRPPWPQVACELASPSSTLPSPSPFQIPNTPGQWCTILRRHRDSGFTRSGTIRTCPRFKKSTQIELGPGLEASIQHRFD